MLIGLCGKACSGKSTVAQLLVDRYGFLEVSFAGPLKRGLIEMLGLTEEQVCGTEKEVVDPFWKVTPRELMQVVGTELFRKRLPEIIPEMKEIWIRQAQRIIEMHLEQGKNVVVSDVRFIDEADMVRTLHGEIWQVNRPHHIGTSQSCHESEQTFHKINPDIILRNDADIHRLYSQVLRELEKNMINASFSGLRGPGKDIKDIYTVKEVDSPTAMPTIRTRRNSNAK